MKMTKEHKLLIKEMFINMKYQEDLITLINYVFHLNYGDNAIKIDKNDLRWLTDVNFRRETADKWNERFQGISESIKNRLLLSTETYHTFYINKKNGGKRQINAPVSKLKSVQRAISVILQCVFEPHKSAFGFVADKSVADNASLHTKQNYVYNIDLKDFFPSIDRARIKKCLEFYPFNLNAQYSDPVSFEELEKFADDFLEGNRSIGKAKYINGRYIFETIVGDIYCARSIDFEKKLFVLIGNSSIKSRSNESLENTIWMVNKVPAPGRIQIADFISKLCCTKLETQRLDEEGNILTITKEVLPQGSPASPVLTNIVCQRLDMLLTGVAKRFGLRYSRYADDITFSSMHNVYQKDGEFITELSRIIKDQRFMIKEEKTRLQKHGQRKEVTGLLVNEKVNVQKRYIKQLRMWLYYCERYGVSKASHYILELYEKDKGHINSNPNPAIKKVIQGKLNYLKMIKGKDNQVYLKLKKRYDLIFGTVDLKDKRARYLQNVIKIFHEKGLSEAMAFYNKN